MLARASRHTSTSAGTLRLGELISYFGGVSSGEKAAVTCDNNPGAAADRFGHACHIIDRKEAHTTEEGTHVHRKLKCRNYCEPPVRLYYYIYTAAIADCLRWYLGCYFRTRLSSQCLKSRVDLCKATKSKMSKTKRIRLYVWCLDLR